MRITVTVKGMTNMNKLQRELNSLVDDAIRSYGRRQMGNLELSIDSIPDSVQDEIVMAYWELEGREIEAITQTDDTDNILSSIYKLFDKRSTLNKMELADNIHKSIKDYYYKKIDLLIDERICYLQSFWSEPSPEREDYYLEGSMY